MKVRKYSRDLLAAVLDHMAIAYSVDGSVNVRFREDMIRQALRAGAVQLRRRHRQLARNQERKAYAVVLGAELRRIVAEEGGAR